MYNNNRVSPHFLRQQNDEHSHTNILPNAFVSVSWLEGLSPGAWDDATAPACSIISRDRTLSRSPVGSNATVKVTVPSWHWSLTRNTCQNTYSRTQNPEVQAGWPYVLSSVLVVHSLRHQRSRHVPRHLYTHQGRLRHHGECHPGQ